MAKLNTYPILSSNKITFGYRYSLSEVTDSTESLNIVLNELMNYHSNKKIMLDIGIDKSILSIHNIISPTIVIPEITNINDKDTLAELKNNKFDCVLTLDETPLFTDQIEFARYIRVDINCIECKSLVNMSRRFDKKVIICGINQNGDYGKAEALNPDYYEGLAVANTMVNTTTKQEYFSSSVLTVLAKIRNVNYDVSEVAKYISYDSKLSATLLRYANSAAFKGMSGRVNSIKDAVIRLGKESLTYIVMIANNSKITNTAFGEVIKTSLMRSLLCKTIAEEIGSRLFKAIKLPTEDAYIIGLFSELDVLTHKSMKEILVGIPHSQEVENALVYKDGVGGTILKLLIAYDENNQNRIQMYTKELGLNISKLENIYYKSVKDTNMIWEEVCNGKA